MRSGPAASSSAAPQSSSSNPRGTLFLDNGAHHIKAMYLPPSVHPSGTRHPNAAPSAPQPLFLTVPHCVGASPHAGRGLIGGEVLRQLPHYHSLLLRRPCTKRGGFLTDALLEGPVWEYVLEQFALQNEQEIDVWMTVPFAAPKGVARCLYALLAGRFHFASLTLVSSSYLALIAAEADRCGLTGHQSSVGDASPNSWTPGCGLVLDVGFSGTTVVPYLDYLPVTTSITRCDVGGKLLTNRLKEYLSFTQMHLMEDEWLVNHIKEQCCFVAQHPHDLYLRYGSMEVKEYLQRCKSRGKLPQLHQHPLHNEWDGAPTSPLVQVYYLPSVPQLQPLGCTAAEVRARLYGQDSEPEEPDPAADLAEQSKDLHGLAPSGRKRSRSPEAMAQEGGAEAAWRPSSKPKVNKRTEETEQLLLLPQLFLQQEMMSIPELLFTPGNVGIPQAGVTEAATTALFSRGLLAALPLLQPFVSSSPLYRHVVVFGGTSNFPNFLERLHEELQSYAESGTLVHVTRSSSRFCGGVVSSGVPRASASKGLVEEPSVLETAAPPSPPPDQRVDLPENGWVPTFLDAAPPYRPSARSAPDLLPLSPAELQPLKGAHALLTHPHFAAQRLQVETHRRLHFQPRTVRKVYSGTGAGRPRVPSTADAPGPTVTLPAATVEEIHAALQALW